MTQHIQTQLIRPFSLALATVFALFLGACGDADASTQTADAAAEPTAAPETTTSAAPIEAAVEEAVETTALAPAVSGDTFDVTGEMAFELNPSCSIGPPLSAEPADCETYAGYTIVPATLTATRTGTFDGTETFHAVFAVDADGGYVFAGISSFVGAVDGCGEGTAVYNSAGTGSFDIEQSSEAGTLVLGPMDAVSYTAAPSKLATLDLAFEATMTTLDPTTLDISGTVNCSDEPLNAGSFDAVRPESSVVEAGAREWTGAASYVLGATCNPSVYAAGSPNACPTTDGFLVMPLNNSLVLGAPFDGEAVFVGTNIIADSNYEHAGIFIFDGTIDGCGEGSVVMANEAIGSFLSPVFPHARGFTPPLFDTGALGVHADGTVKITGQVSGTMEGSYSC
ncbi:MAG: hypothetical protein ACR2P0_05560 [Acidimicrobiales bacterium]